MSTKCVPQLAVSQPARSQPDVGASRDCSMAGGHPAAQQSPRVQRSWAL